MLLRIGTALIGLLAASLLGAAAGPVRERIVPELFPQRSAEKNFLTIGLGDVFPEVDIVRKAIDFASKLPGLTIPSAQQPSATTLATQTINTTPQVTQPAISSAPIARVIRTNQQNRDILIAGDVRVAENIDLTGLPQSTVDNLVFRQGELGFLGGNIEIVGVSRDDSNSPTHIDVRNERLRNVFDNTPSGLEEGSSKFEKSAAKIKRGGDIDPRTGKIIPDGKYLVLNPDGTVASEVSKTESGALRFDIKDAGKETDQPAGGDDSSKAAEQKQAQEQQQSSSGGFIGNVACGGAPWCVETGAQARYCYKYGGAPGGPNLYDGVRTCNAGVRCITVAKANDPYCGSGKIHQDLDDCSTNGNLCNKTATIRKYDKNYACLWLTCDGGRNAIWDKDSKKCGCDDGGAGGGGGGGEQQQDQPPQQEKPKEEPPAQEEKETEGITTEPDPQLDAEAPGDESSPETDKGQDAALPTPEGFNEGQITEHNNSPQSQGRVLIKSGANISTLDPAAIDRAADLANNCQCDVVITQGVGFEGSTTHRDGGINFDVRSTKEVRAYLENQAALGNANVYPTTFGNAYAIGNVEYLYETSNPNASGPHLHVQNIQPNRPSP